MVETRQPETGSRRSRQEGLGQRSGVRGREEGPWEGVMEPLPALPFLPPSLPLSLS